MLRLLNWQFKHRQLLLSVTKTLIGLQLSFRKCDQLSSCLFHERKKRNKKKRGKQKNSWTDFKLASLPSSFSHFSQLKKNGSRNPASSGSLPSVQEAGLAWRAPMALLPNDRQMSAARLDFCGKVNARRTVLLPATFFHLSCVVLFFKQIPTGRLIELLLLQKRDEKKYQGKEATRWDRGYRFHSFNVLLL